MQRGSGPSTRVELCIVCHRTKTASPGLHLTSVGRGQTSANVRRTHLQCRAAGTRQNGDPGGVALTAVVGGLVALALGRSLAHRRRVVAQPVAIPRVRVLTRPLRPRGPERPSKLRLLAQEGLHVVAGAAQQADVARALLGHVAQRHADEDGEVGEAGVFAVAEVCRVEPGAAVGARVAVCSDTSGSAG